MIPVFVRFTRGLIGDNGTGNRSGCQAGSRRKALVTCVAGSTPPLSPPKPLRKAERLFPQGMNARFAMWAESRGGHRSQRLAWFFFRERRGPGGRRRRLSFRRAWSYEDWRMYLYEHPIVRRFCQQLVWIAEGGVRSAKGVEGGSAVHGFAIPAMS